MKYTFLVWTYCISHKNFKEYQPERLGRAQPHVPKCKHCVAGRWPPPRASQRDFPMKHWDHTKSRDLYIYIWIDIIRNWDSTNNWGFEEPENRPNLSTWGLAIQWGFDFPRCGWIEQITWGTSASEGCQGDGPWKGGRQVAHGPFLRCAKWKFLQLCWLPQKNFRSGRVST